MIVIMEINYMSLIDPRDCLPYKNQRRLFLNHWRFGGTRLVVIQCGYPVLRFPPSYYRGLLLHDVEFCYWWMFVRFTEISARDFQSL